VNTGTGDLYLAVRRFAIGRDEIGAGTHKARLETSYEVVLKR
jgi:hypothetical protein